MKNINLTRNLKSVHYGTALRPSRDWLVLLALTFALMLASVAWNLWSFAKVTEGESIGAAATSQTTDSTAFEGVKKLFEERAVEEAKYRNEYRFVDPRAGGR